MIIDHIGFSVSNLQASIQFYQAALLPLNIGLVVEVNGWVGLGTLGQNGKAELWFGQDEIIQSPMHIAFLADKRASVDQFYLAALQAGGKCNGKPGIRAIYHPHYYGAFIIDPDGHNIEAVCHTPPLSS